MREQIPLTFAQREIMAEFYSVSPEKVFLNKSKRKRLWDMSKRGTIDAQMMDEFKWKCPALYHQIMRHEQNGNNVQSAVFSECVYAQSLANVFRLSVFKNCYDDSSFLPMNVTSLLDSYSLTPRYAYVSGDGRRMLVQAGGCGGIDSALITVIDLKIFTIEFKEPAAKLSEPDLPKYGEDGLLRVTKEFLQGYPQFGMMLAEQGGLNFFDSVGHNINDFSAQSVNTAITNNYNAKKFADVVCTEDRRSYLVMLPINQVSLWAGIVGEIRPAGRNNYQVWTPNALRRFLYDMGATVDDGEVCVPLSRMGKARERGGDNTISRYKINSLFFVRVGDCRVAGQTVKFNLNSVRQLNPTITAKMFFRGLSYGAVKVHYFGDVI